MKPQSLLESADPQAASQHLQIQLEGCDGDTHKGDREKLTESFQKTGYIHGRFHRKNRKGGTASLRSRTCVKRNAVFGARFKGLSLYFLSQNGNLIRIKMAWIHS